MSDPVLTVLAEVVWKYRDQVLGEVTSTLYQHGENDLVRVLDESRTEVEIVLTAIMQPGDDLTEHCPKCRAWPGHTCVDRDRRREPRSTSHGERKAALIRRLLADAKETA